MSPKLAFYRVLAIAIPVVILGGGYLLLSGRVTLPSMPAGTVAGAETPPPVVFVEAERTDYVPGALHDGGEWTSVKVTVTNNSEGQDVSVNPLDFTVTDTRGEVQRAETFGDDRQLDPVTLAPGEHTSGTITVEGDVTPARVTFDVSGSGNVRADVE